MLPATLQRYVCGLLLRDLALVGGAVLLLLVPGLAVHAVGRVPTSDPALLVGYLGIALASLSPYLIPIVLLFAVTRTFGGLCARREWIGVQLLGLHPARTLIAPLAGAGLLSVGMFLVLGWMLPGLQVAKQELLRSSTRRALQSLNPARSTLHLGPAFLHRKAVDPEDPRTFYGVFLHLPPSPAHPFRDLFARELHYELRGDVLELDLRGVSVPDPDSGTHIEHHGLARVRLPLDDLLPTSSWNREKPSYLPMPELDARRRREEDPERRAAWSYEWHRRLATSMTPLLFTVLGAWCAVRFGRRSVLPALWAAGLGLLAFHVATNEVSRHLSRSAACPPVVAAWWPVWASVPLALRALASLARG